MIFSLLEKNWPTASALSALEHRAMFWEIITGKDLPLDLTPCILLTLPHIVLRGVSGLTDEQNDFQEADLARFIVLWAIALFLLYSITSSNLRVFLSLFRATHLPWIANLQSSFHQGTLIFLSPEGIEVGIVS